MGTLVCFKCGRQPSEIGEYQAIALKGYCTPDDAARSDGTYNAQAQTFCCTDCYIRLGMPVSPGGWVAPARGEMPEPKPEPGPQIGDRVAIRGEEGEYVVEGVGLTLTTGPYVQQLYLREVETGALRIEPADRCSPL